MERLNERADDDSTTHDSLRAKWRAAEQYTNNWVQDVHDAMLKWGVNRSRTEEEIIRRQEASRFTGPMHGGLNVTDIVSPQRRMPKPLLEEGAEVLRLGIEASVVDSSQGGYASDEDENPIWLSPYAKKPGGARENFSPLRRPPHAALKFNKSA
eukprot:4160125-Pyramimonas_sp.AAC.1